MDDDKIHQQGDECESDEEEDSSHLECHLYDQNRNLNIHDTTDYDKIQELDVSGASKTRGARSQSSPVQSTNSDQTASDSCPTTESTQRISSEAASLDLATQTPSSKLNGSQHLSELGEPLAQSPLQEASIKIGMIDVERSECHERLFGLATDQERQSLLRHLGRRMSTIPHLLGPSGPRLSQFRTKRKLARSYSDRSSNQPGELSQATFESPSVGSQPGAAVLGVGGTITTVTRDSRKTAPLPRLVAKNGTVNLFLDNIDRRQYVRDLFTTMIDIKWRYNLMAAAFGFVFSWLFFACIWYIVLYVHDDLAHENDPAWSPCIVNVNSFSAALLFSIETQSTLGFGSRIISVECPGAIAIFCIQLIFGVVVECLIVGMVFAKLSRPAKRSQTIMFSKYATICLREGQMCLTFRVGDVRSKSHVIGATIRASLVSQKITQEGENIPFYHHQLDVKIDDSKNSLLLIWPVTIVHLIDRSSPFFHLDSEQLANFKFEIITVIEGTVESTGQSIQVRSSYLPSEVKWGYRFEPIVSTHGFGKYAQTIIDYNKFNRILAVETPQCSPEDYYATKAIQ